MSANIELSIISPIYNGVTTLPTFVDLLVTEMGKMGCSYEIILVDDCSPDESWQIIKSLCKKNKNLKAIRLAKNKGQQIAVSVGLQEATGECSIVLDGDLENPVSEIPNLYNKVKEGHDIVYAVTKKRNSIVNTLTSQIFWFVVQKLLKVDIVRNQLMMRGFSKQARVLFNRYTEEKRTIAGICMDIGLKQDKIEVDINPRHSGKSNYNFIKRLNLFIDIVLSLSETPLNFIIFIGMGLAVFTGSISVYYSIDDPFYLAHNGDLFIAFICSIILFTLGIISRYLSLIYIEVKRRPLFNLDESININDGHQ
ncbi:MAG: glycosyltransferase [Pseudomonadales bacterium]|nr:glycosyltransferase [Pseudomonadales bacterium]